MLKIRIISAGRDKESWITEGCRHYRTLLSKYSSVEMVYLPTIKSAGSFSPGEIKAKEFEQFSKHLGKGTIVALDMHGRKMDSPAFARFIDGCQSNTKGQITFLIGGAYGLDERILKSSGAAISLSPLTFSHQLVRLVFLEQLYRAFSILHGTPYHK